MACLIPDPSTDSTINHQRWYIATEFLRYFPDANEIAVIHRNDGEVIDVRIFTDYGSHNVVKDFTFEVGSDDDWYCFYTNIGADEGYTITIPLDGNPIEEA